MNILVFVKEVPDDSVAVSVKENKADIKDITPVVNAFDTYSLEMAARLKEKEGGEVTVLSIGGESVKNSLKNCLAVGADNAYFVEYENYKKLDPRSIAMTLINAKERLEEEKGKFDLFCFGKETTDYEASQVGVYFAEKLGIGSITNIISMEVDGETLTTEQETEEGKRVVETTLPCAVTITKPDYDPRYATIKSKMAARRKEIPALEVEVSDENLHEIVQEFEPAKREAGVKIIEEDTEVAVARAIEIMKKEKAI